MTATDFVGYLSIFGKLAFSNPRLFQISVMCVSYIISIGINITPILLKDFSSMEGFGGVTYKQP